jgi:nicotinate-nucleotide--dimethylbenzimidazole phosphoribosyltransferase
MSVLDDMKRKILGPDEAIRATVARRLDGKTKPPRSLGRLEDLAAAVAAIQRTASPSVRRKAVVVMAADHGVASSGVSAYPQEVTGQMLLNFAAGGAAICVLARQAGAEVVIVDMGCAAPVKGAPAVLDRRIGPGTRDFTKGPAMTREEALKALEAGIAIGSGLAEREVQLIGLGEMGIGNTTAASAMAAAFLGLPAEQVTGRGTGVDDAGYRRKLEAIRKALEVNRPDPADGLDVLAKVGGYEIAGLAGVTIGAAARNVPVVTDGLIATAAAVAATRLAPAVRGCLLPSHGSVEIGHRRLLDALGLKPLLDLEMRLGEGTGAALAMTLVDASIRILDEMATFESAGVSGL